MQVGEVRGRRGGGRQPLVKASRGHPVAARALRAPQFAAERRRAAGRRRPDAGQHNGLGHRRHGRQRALAVQLARSRTWRALIKHALNNSAPEQRGSFACPARFPQVREVLLRRHRHLYEKNKENSAAKLPIIRSLADIGRNYSTSRSKFRALFLQVLTAASLFPRCAVTGCVS